MYSDPERVLQNRYGKRRGFSEEFVPPHLGFPKSVSSCFMRSYFRPVRMAVAKWMDASDIRC